MIRVPPPLNKLDFKRLIVVIRDSAHVVRFESKVLVDKVGSLTPPPTKTVE